MIMVDFAKLLATPREPKRVHVYRCKLCGEVEEYDLGPKPAAKKHRPFYGRCFGLMTVIRVDFDPDAEERYRREVDALLGEQRTTAGFCSADDDEHDRLCRAQVEAEGLCPTHLAREHAYRANRAGDR